MKSIRNNRRKERIRKAGLSEAWNFEESAVSSRFCAFFNYEETREKRRRNRRENTEHERNFSQNQYPKIWDETSWGWENRETAARSHGSSVCRNTHKSMWAQPLKIFCLKPTAWDLVLYGSASHRWPSGWTPCATFCSSRENWTPSPSSHAAARRRNVCSRTASKRHGCIISDRQRDKKEYRLRGERPLLGFLFSISRNLRNKQSKFLTFGLYFTDPFSYTTSQRQDITWNEEVSRWIRHRESGGSGWLKK